MHQGNARSALIRTLDDGDQHKRAAAAAALKGKCEDEDVRRALLECLEDHEHVEDCAATSLLDATNSESFRRSLVKDLADESWAIQCGASKILSATIEYEDVRRVFVDALTSEDGDARHLSLVGLSYYDLEEIGEAISATVEHDDFRLALMKLLSDEDSWIRMSAVAALGNGNQRQDIRDGLIQALRDPDSSVRSAAAWALYGADEHEPVRAALVEAFDDEDRGVRIGVACALRSSIVHEKVRDAYIRALSDNDESVHSQITRALSNAKDCEAIRKALIEAFRNRTVDATVLPNANEHAEVRKLLIEALSDQDSSVRFDSARALKVATGHDDVRTALIVALDDENKRVRWGIVKTLATVLDDEDSRHALINLLSDTSEDVREAAVVALSDCGHEDAKKAIVENSGGRFAQSETGKLLGPLATFVIGFWVLLFLGPVIFSLFSKSDETNADAAKEEKRLARIESATDMLQASWDQINVRALAPKSPREIVANLNQLGSQTNPLEDRIEADRWYLFCEDIKQNGAQFVAQIQKLIEKREWNTHLAEPLEIKNGTVVANCDGTISKQQNELLGNRFPSQIANAKYLMILEYSSKEIAEYRVKGLKFNGKVHESSANHDSIGIDAYEWIAELMFVEVDSGTQYGYKKFVAQDPEELEWNPMAKGSGERASEKIKEMVSEYLKQ